MNWKTVIEMEEYLEQTEEHEAEEGRCKECGGELIPILGSEGTYCVECRTTIGEEVQDELVGISIQDEEDDDCEDSTDGLGQSTGR